MKSIKVYKPILLISILSLLILGIFHLNTQAEGFSIAGKVMDYTDAKPIRQATVTLYSNTLEQVVSTIPTNNTGDYEFTNVTSGEDYTISVSKTTEPAVHGLNTLDLTLIRKHILNAPPLDNIHKIIAANAFSTDYNVNTLDLTSVRSRVVNSVPLPSGLWKFFSSDIILNSNNYLTPSYQQRTITSLSGNLTSQDFTAVKMGDVDNNWDNQEIIENCGVGHDINNYEGQNYSTVQIGSQCWMAENLNVGNPLFSGEFPSNNDTIEKYCYGFNPSNCTTYGGLYRWDEAMDYINTDGTQGICPVGWHIPTKVESDNLIDFLGGNYLAGGEMKETGNTYWDDNVGATNESGFSSRGGGFNSSGSNFNYLKIYGQFWTSTDAGGGQSYALVNINESVYGWTSQYLKTYSNSIRCIKDNN
jgi:uncharacterized protein (TIGR02145 family)